MGVCVCACSTSVRERERERERVRDGENRFSGLFVERVS